MATERIGSILQGDCTMHTPLRAIITRALGKIIVGHARQHLAEFSAERRGFSATVRNGRRQVDCVARAAYAGKCSTRSAFLQSISSSFLVFEVFRGRQMQPRIFLCLGGGNRGGRWNKSMN